MTMLKVVGVVLLAVYLSSLINHGHQRTYAIDREMQKFRNKPVFMQTTNSHIRGDVTEDGERTADMVGRN